MSRAWRIIREVGRAVFVALAAAFGGGSSVTTAALDDPRTHNPRPEDMRPGRR